MSSRKSHEEFLETHNTLLNQLRDAARETGRLQQAEKIMGAGLVLILDHEISLSEVLHLLKPLNIYANVVRLGECGAIKLSRGPV